MHITPQQQHPRRWFLICILILVPVITIDPWLWPWRSPEVTGRSSEVKKVNTYIFFVNYLIDQSFTLHNHIIFWNNVSIKNWPQRSFEVTLCQRSRKSLKSTFRSHSYLGEKIQIVYCISKCILAIPRNIFMKFWNLL